MSFNNTSADSNSSLGMVIPPTGVTQVLEETNLMSTRCSLVFFFKDVTAAHTLRDVSQKPTSLPVGFEDVALWNGSWGSEDLSIFYILVVSVPTK